MQLILISLLAALVGAPFAWAAEPAKAPADDGTALTRAQRIGYVDISRVWSEYRRRGDFDKEIRALRQDLSNQERSRMDQVTRYEKEIEQLAMGTPDRLALEEKRKAALKETEEFRRKGQEELNRRFVAMLNQLFGDVTREVEAVAKEGNYDMVIKDQSPDASVSNPGEAILQIGQRVVLYSKPEYDLTSSVIKRLNEKYGAERKKEEPVAEPKKQPEPPARER